MDIYVIVGDSNSGKSSIIRSLTGCSHSGSRHFQLNNDAHRGVNDVYVMLSALQESGKKHNAPRKPDEFVDYINALGAKENFDKIIFPLRLRKTRIKKVDYPDADVYFRHFMDQAGWRIIAVATLSHDAPNYSFNSTTISVFHEPLSPTIPVNTAAAHIRSGFGW
jgi:GTPase SAR1 family protein